MKNDRFGLAILRTFDWVIVLYFTAAESAKVPGATRQNQDVQSVHPLAAILV